MYFNFKELGLQLKVAVNFNFVFGLVGVSEQISKKCQK